MGLSSLTLTNSVNNKKNIPRRIPFGEVVGSPLNMLDELLLLVHQHLGA
jgi:hypothetical protein